MYLLAVNPSLAAALSDSPNSLSFSKLNPYMTQEIDVTLKQNPEELPVINWYLAKQLLEQRKSNLALKSLKLLPFDEDANPSVPKRIDSFKKLQSDSVIFLTANLERGLSDILLLQPILRAQSEKMKARGWSGKLNISCSNEFRHLFYQQEFLGEFLPEAPTLQSITKYDYLIGLGISLERLRAKLGVAEWGEIDLKVNINLPPGVAERWQARFTGRKPRVFLHWHAFDERRRLPVEWFKTIMAEFPEAEYYCSIYGETNDGELFPGGPINLWPDEENILDMFGVLECMDAVVTTNTGIAHAAGAIGRPTIVIFTGKLYGWGDLWPQHHEQIYPSQEPVGLAENLSLPPEKIISQVVEKLKRITASASHAVSQPVAT